MIICDLLFSRYGSNAEKVLKMEPRRGFEFYQEAARQRQDERLFLRWVHGYQMAMSFGDFREAAGVSPPSTSGKPMTEEEIYAKVKDILRKE